MVSSILMVVASVALVDFISGVVHWAEDTFWTDTTPIVGRWIVAPNIRRHNDPTAFVANSWLRSSWDLLAAGVIIAAVSWAPGILDSAMWAFIVLGVNANQIHRWNHMPAAIVPLPVRALRRLHILQSRSHHAVHHRGEKNTAYCVVTPFLNPILDSLGFWRALERATVPSFGAPRREDLIH